MDGRSGMWKSEVKLLKERRKVKVDEIERGQQKRAIEVGELIAEEVLKNKQVHLTILKDNYDTILINGEEHKLSGGYYDIEDVISFLQEIGFYPQKNEITNPTIKWLGDVNLSKTQPRMI